MARRRRRPTAAQRDRVALLVAHRWGEAEIAAACDVDVPTLRARFGFELRYGHHLSAARLCAGIYIAALEGSVWAQGKLLERFGLPAELWPRVRHRLRRTADGRVISRTERAAIDERRRRAMH